MLPWREGLGTTGPEEPSASKLDEVLEETGEGSGSVVWVEVCVDP